LVDLRLDTALICFAWLEFQKNRGQLHKYSEWRRLPLATLDYGVRS